MSIYLSFYISTYLSFYISTYLSFYLSVIWLPIYLSYIYTENKNTRLNLFSLPVKENCFIYLFTFTLYFYILVKTEKVNQTNISLGLILRQLFYMVTIRLASKISSLYWSSCKWLKLIMFYHFIFNQPINFKEKGINEV